MRIAYFVNQYPKVSHTFIRREIHALETLGLSVVRIALRGWHEDLADPEDESERGITRYALRQGLPGLVLAGAREFLLGPVRWCRTFLLATRMAYRSDRPLVYHWAYFLEACVVAAWLRGSRAEHIHAHFGTNSTDVAMLAALMTGMTYSFTAHGPEEFDRPLSIGLPEKIRRARFVVAISSFGRSQLFRWVPHSEWAKVKVVRCGLDSSFLEAPPSCCPDVPRLVCVGRLCEQKGQLLLVHAAAKLAERGIRCEIVLAGDGEMRESIEARITELGLQSQFRITGWIASSMVQEELKAARALVLASFAEGLPVVIMEAMALGRPVVSSYVAGIPELVLPGTNGWLVPAGCVDSLADALEACLNCQPSELDRMGMAARDRVRGRHSALTESSRLKEYFLGFRQSDREEVK